MEAVVPWARMVELIGPHYPKGRRGRPPLGANSFNDFGRLVRGGKRIDWILARAQLEVRATEVITFKQGEQWPSDHFPVAAWLILK